MAIIVHDHGDPSPVIAAVSPDVQAFAATVQPALAVIIPPPIKSALVALESIEKRFEEAAEDVKKS